MKGKGTRKFRAGLDLLEPRRVPSAVQPAAHVVPLRGTGTLTTTGTTDIGGTVQATIAVNGTFTTLGASSGTFLTDVNTSTLHFNAQGALTAANGDQLDLSFSGSDRAGRPGQSRAVGRFHVSFTGGTGAFAGATGGGTLTVVQDTATQQETFTLNAKVRESS